ncbi:hypothetical protein [Stigmatella aurantiaca]|nr:hypothetical protein [Stigmatella aurantiaca]
MERIHSPPPPATHAFEADAVPVALSELVEGVRSPAAERKDVDALLQGLARPLAVDESPRQRADLLLSLLNSRHICSMRGTAGGSVEAAAVRALMELGHPYALEIPPEALDSLHQDSLEKELGPRHIPALGICLALLGTAPALMAGPWALLLALPTLMALTGGALELRGLQKAGGVLLALLGLGLLTAGGYAILEDLQSSHENYHGMGIVLGLLAMAPGLFLTLGAYLLRHPAWRIPGETSGKDEAA